MAIPKEMPKDVMAEVMRRRQEEEVRSRESQDDEDDFSSLDSSFLGINEPDLGEDPPDGGSDIEAQMSVMRSDLNRIQDRLRDVANTLHGLESSFSDMGQAFGIGQGARKGLFTPETISAITETRDRLKHLEEFGFNAQLSESFECFKPENMEKIFNRLDSRVDALSKMGKSYESALSSAVSKAMSKGLLLGLVSGCVGGAMCAAAILFGARILESFL